jgi:mRNA interferase MazF
VVKYIPSKGDIVTLDFDPQSGHEQKGRRPALIMSNKIFNAHLGLAFACPITSTKRNSPFHVYIKTDNISGYVMSEQIKSIDYKTRKIKFIEKVDSEILEDVEAIIKAIME